MKRKINFILFIITLFFSSILNNVNTFPILYKLNVRSGNEYIYQVTELNTPLELVEVNAYDLNDKMKIEVVDIDIYSDYYEIKIDEWNYISNNESFKETADNRYTEKIFKDPTETGYLDYFILSPVNLYLSDYAETNPNYIVSGNNISVHMEGTYTVLTYDSNGILSKSYQACMYAFGFFFRTVSLISQPTKDKNNSIPGYDITILIELTIIISLGFIYFLEKKIKMNISNIKMSYLS